MPIQFDRRVGVFVDSANIHASAQGAFNKKVRYEKLLELAVGNNKLYRAIIYAVRHESVNAENTVSHWQTRMEQFGYEVRMKDIQRWGDGRTKADWDVGLTMDVVRMLDQIDEVILVSGDGDFVPLVRYCQSNGRIVRVISVENSTNSELKNITDYYYPINDDRDLLFTPGPRHREPVREPVKPSSNAGFGEGL
jgi:uncharacterized LabA/DUF88 family protein